MEKVEFDMSYKLQLAELLKEGNKVFCTKSFSDRINGQNYYLTEEIWQVDSPVHDDENNPLTPSQYDENSMVWLYNEKYSHREEVYVEEIQKIRKLHDLDEEELKFVFDNIRWGSIYTADYRTDLGVPEKEVCDFCTSFYEESYDPKMEKENTEDKPLFTFENFKDYVYFSE